MNNLTPKAVAFFSSLFTALATLIILAALINSGVLAVTTRDAFIITLVVFVLAFIVSSILISSVIIKRLNELHQTIRSFRGKKTDDPLYEHGHDIVDDIRSELLGWSDERKNELEQLKKLESYRKEFLGNVSHELKTPIFNIQGYVLTLLEGGLEDETINRDYLQRAERSIDRMISIVEDLVAISQLETGELELEPETFDIVPLILDVFKAQEMKATGKGIILSYDDPEEKPHKVVADRFRIRQVFTNLIVNSIKYGKEYGETRVKLTDAGDNVLVEISDNGIGIASEHLPRLFERFYRVDKSRSREMGGTGLGLAIVKHIIEAHGQTISVASTEGKGATFSFTLKKG